MDHEPMGHQWGQPLLPQPELLEEEGLLLKLSKSPKLQPVALQVRMMIRLNCLKHRRRRLALPPSHPRPVSASLCDPIEASNLSGDSKWNLRRRQRYFWFRFLSHRSLEAHSSMSSLKAVSKKGHVDVAQDWFHQTRHKHSIFSCFAFRRWLEAETRSSTEPSMCGRGRKRECGGSVLMRRGANRRTKTTASPTGELNCSQDVICSKLIFD